MTTSDVSTVAELVGSNEQTILPEWIDLQKNAGSLQTGRITESELVSQSREFLHLLRDGLAKGGNDASNPAYGPTKQMPRRHVPLARPSGVFSKRDGNLHLFAEAAALQHTQPQLLAFASPGRGTDLGRDPSPRRDGPVHAYGFPEEPGRGHCPSAARDRRTFDACCQTVGRHPRAAVDRDTGQPADPRS
jgi:hypothetical protein